MSSGVREQWSKRGNREKNQELTVRSRISPGDASLGRCDIDLIDGFAMAANTAVRGYVSITTTLRMERR